VKPYVSYMLGIYGLSRLRDGPTIILCGSCSVIISVNTFCEAVVFNRLG
jgi:uncharacterized membrane protein